MSLAYFAPALHALYAAEVDVLLTSQRDVGWTVELTPASGLRLHRHFNAGQLAELAAWVCGCADVAAPGWRSAALR